MRAFLTSLVLGIGLVAWLVSCSVGSVDVPLGYHVFDGTGGSASGGSGGSSGASGACTTIDLEGTLRLTSEQTGRCARAAACSLEPVDVHQNSCEGSRCELWHALPIEDHWYVLTNLQNGGCLDVGNGAMIDGATIQAFPCHARENQQWQARCGASGTVQLVNRNSGLLLGVHNDVDGGLVQQWSDSDTATELWRLEQQADAYVELVATSEQAGQAWRFVQAAPPDGWQAAGFDDSAWSPGPAPFGTRYEAPWTPRSNWSTAGLWLRRHITLDSLPESLDLRVFNNGPIEVYVNGTLAYQGPPSVGYRVAPVSPTALAALTLGDNELAAHVTQNPDGAFGPYFDLGLGRLAWR